MYQRDLVRKAWADVGLYRSRDARLRQFLKHVNDTPMECWPELVDLVRAHYPEYLEKLALPIWNTGDKLLRLNIIRNAALDRPDEVKVIQKLVRGLRVVEDALELHTVIYLAPVEVLNMLDRRKGLPNNLRVLVDVRRARLMFPPIAPAEGDVPA